MTRARATHQATAEAAKLARKRKSVDSSEMAWLQTHVNASKDGAATGAPGRGRLQAIADTIIGTLQFSITNLHIRYEVGAMCTSATRSAHQPRSPVAPNVHSYWRFLFVSTMPM